MTDPVTAPPEHAKPEPAPPEPAPLERTPPAPVAEPAGKRRNRLGRHLRIVLTTMGFTSLAWLVIGGFFVSWLWDRPYGPAAGGTLADRAAAAGERPRMPDDAGAIPATHPLAPGATLVVPVAGVAPQALTDTYADARSGGARHHDAIDIMAAEGTPVVAAASGSVEKLFTSDEGGKTIYIRSGDGNWVYYYAHLQAYAPGLAEGQAVRAGDRIASVGSTGNADSTAPHLHFAVMSMAPGEKWYEGAAVNPYPLLAGRR